MRPSSAAPRRWALVLAAWSLPAVLSTFETIVFWRMSGLGHPAWRAVVTQTPGWLAYVLLTPAILALGRRLPLRPPLSRGTLARRLAVHAGAALLAGVAYAGAATLATLAFSPLPQRTGAGQLLIGWYLASLPVAALGYSAVLGVGHALAWLEESRHREREAARLSAQLAEARLGALRMQLHPHFLFNTLNAITVLARDGDTAATTRMLELLAGLLREVLRTDARHHVPLAEELDFVRRYLAIEEVRFSDRLRVRERVDDGAADALVPAFVLQPLVENALRHGLGRRAAGGTVEVGARVRHDTGAATLELWVRDDGAGLPAGWTGAAGYGIGLANTAARLAELHGAAAALHVSAAAGGGTVARVRLPLSRATAAAA